MLLLVRSPCLGDVGHDDDCIGVKRVRVVLDFLRNIPVLVSQLQSPINHGISNVVSYSDFIIDIFV